MCSGLGSWCFSWFDAQFVLFVRCCLCRRTGICHVCMAGTDGPASRACVVRHPLVLAGSNGPASRARAVCDPLFLFHGCCRCVACVPLLALRLLVSARPLAARWCLLPPAAAPHPPHPNTTPLLVVFCPPFASWCCRACRQLLPPPLPRFLSRGRWRFALCFPSFPLSLVVAVCRLAAGSRLLLSPNTSGFVFCGYRRPAARLPLFSLCHARGFAPLGRLPPPPVCVWWVSSLCRSFSRVLMLFSCFFVPLAFAPVWFGFFSPSARGLSCALCVARWCRAPPPRQLLLVMCGAPRLVVWCRGWLWAVLCGTRCFSAPCSAGVRAPCCVEHCSVVLLALSFAVCRWRFCWCHTLLRCAVLSCAVFRSVWCRCALLCAVVFSLVLCGVVVVALFSLCLLGSAHLRVCAACCSPPPLVSVSRLVLPCCAGLFCALQWCVAACCVALFGMQRAVSCFAVSCCASRVVWCCAAFSRAAAPCCVLCRARWRCAVLSFAAPFTGVLRLGALCCAPPLCAFMGCFVPSGVRWRCAVGCVLCCAVPCCAVLRCCLLLCAVLRLLAGCLVALCCAVLVAAFCLVLFAVPCAVLCLLVLCWAVLRRAVLCGAVLVCTVL